MSNVKGARLSPSVRIGTQFKSADRSSDRTRREKETHDSALGEKVMGVPRLCLGMKRANTAAPPKKRNGLGRDVETSSLCVQK